MRGPLTRPRRAVSIAEDAPRFVHERRPAQGEARALVDELWTMQAARCRTLVESALPDAAAELYFNLGAAGRHAVARADEASATRAPAPRAAWVVGPRAAPLLVAKEIVDCDVVAVRLRVGVVARALGVPAWELAGALVDLDRLWPSAVVAEIRERIAAAPTPAARLAVAERLVLARLAPRRDEREEARAAAVCAALGGAAPIRVAAAAAALGLTHRRVIALCEREVGLKPRAYHRVARLRRAIGAVGDAPAASWSRIAAQAGYCDQAHLVHEFRALAGVTPGEYAARRSSVGEGFVPVRTVEASAVGERAVEER